LSGAYVGAWCHERFAPKARAGESYSIHPVSALATQLPDVRAK
jgi:hypothetical protein